MSTNYKCDTVKGCIQSSCGEFNSSNDCNDKCQQTYVCTLNGCKQYYTTYEPTTIDECYKSCVTNFNNYQPVKSLNNNMTYCIPINYLSTGAQTQKECQNKNTNSYTCDQRVGCIKTTKYNDTPTSQSDCEKECQQSYTCQGKDGKCVAIPNSYTTTQNNWEKNCNSNCKADDGYACTTNSNCKSLYCSNGQYYDGGEYYSSICGDPQTKGSYTHCVCAPNWRCELNNENPCKTPMTWDDSKKKGCGQSCDNNYDCASGWCCTHVDGNCTLPGVTDCSSPCDRPPTPKT